jgi:hypothetical protein
MQHLAGQHVQCRFEHDAIMVLIDPQLGQGHQQRNQGCGQ